MYSVSINRMTECNIAINYVDFEQGPQITLSDENMSLLRNHGVLDEIFYDLVTIHKSKISGEIYITKEIIVYKMLPSQTLRNWLAVIKHGDAMMDPDKEVLVQVFEDEFTTDYTCTHR